MGKLRDVWENVSYSLWFWPGALTTGGAVAAWALLRLDRWVVASELDLGPWGYGGGADSARQMLSTIAGSIVTVTGVTFSITMVALVLAAAQYTPRVLRNFVRDRVNQTVLGVFVGTFLFTLLILRDIRAGEDAYVPALAVTASIALAVISLAFFLYFLHHIVSSIQVSNIIRNVAHETHDEIERMFKSRTAFVGPARPRGWKPFDEARRIDAETDGYVTRVLEKDLVEKATEHGVTLRVLVGPGDFVSRGAPLALVAGDPPDPTALADGARPAFRVAAQRTLTQDPSYGFRQLVDIAIRALSPGINDPTTACNCIDYLGGFLARVADADWPDPEIRDAAGVVRVRAPSSTFADYVDLACSEIRHYGRGDLPTTLRLLDALARAADATRRPDRHAAILAQSKAVVDGAGRAIHVGLDRELVARRAERLADLLGAGPGGLRPPSPADTVEDGL